MVAAIIPVGYAGGKNSRSANAGCMTDAVHAKGRRIFVQLWHVGRVSHVDLHGGEAPVALSAIRAEAKTFVNNGFADVSAPRALEVDELPGIVESFRQAAANAMEAGSDGVEVHGANGDLLDEFLRETANVRTDAYGGWIGRAFAMTGIGSQTRGNRSIIVEMPLTICRLVTRFINTPALERSVISISIETARCR